MDANHDEPLYHTQLRHLYPRLKRGKDSNSHSKIADDQKELDAILAGTATISLTNNMSKKFLQNLIQYVQEEVDDLKNQFQSRIDRYGRQNQERLKREHQAECKYHDEVEGLRYRMKELEKKQLPSWWHRVPWTRDWHPEYIIESIDDIMRTYEDRKQHFRETMADVRGKCDEGFIESQQYKDYLRLQESHKKLQQEHQKQKFLVHDLFVKTTQQGVEAEISKRVAQGIKETQKTIKQQVVEEQKALWKAKMSGVKKEKKELEEEVSDLEKDIKKLKKKLKAQQADGSESDSD